MMSQLSVRVCDDVHGVEKVYQLQQPYAILGPGSGADVTLPPIGNAKPRRFYLQAVDAGVVAVELASRRPMGVQPVSARLISPADPLRIGPYAVVAERSSGNGSPFPVPVASTRPATFANDLMEDTWLFFVNGHSRATRKSVRHLRESLTLIGRSKRCHLKLSHPRISRFQCSVVRAGNEFWAVSLSRRNQLRVNGHSVTNSRLTVGDILSVGPFRMQLQQGVRPGSSPCLMLNDDSEESLASQAPPEAAPETALSEEPAVGELSQGISQEWEAVRCASDTDVVSLVEQFTAVQHLLMAQSQQQASMLMHLIRNVQTGHDNQQYLLREQISAIQGISNDLQTWRAELEQQAIQPPPRLVDGRIPPALPSAEALQEPKPERIPKTAEEIKAHASLSERINFLERERKSIVQKIIRLLPRNSEADE